MFPESKRYPVAGDRAFTLVELLAVIAIISMLALLLVPASSRMQASTMKAKCASNMRQISAALFAYAGDNNGCLPPVADPWGTPNSPLWVSRIWEYAGYDSANLQGKKSFNSSGSEPKNIFHCPANARQFIPVPTLIQPVNTAYFSYGLNAGPGGDNITGWSLPIRLNGVGKPSQTVMVTETSFALGTRWGYLYYYGLTPHASGANFLYFDGHVEWLSFKDAYETRTNTMFWLGH